MRRALRVLGWTALATATIAAAVVVAAVLDVRVPFVEAALTGSVTRALATATGSTVSVAQARATFGRRLVVEGVRVSVDGAVVLRIPRLEIAYALAPIVRGRLRIERMVVERPWVRAVRVAGGWRLPRPEPSGGGGPGLAVELRDLRVEGGRVGVALLDEVPPRRFAAAGLALRAAAVAGPAGDAVRVRELRFTPRGVALQPVTATTRLSRRRDGTVRVGTLRIDTVRSRLAGTADVVPGRALRGRFALGPLAAADVRAVAPDLHVETDLRATTHVRGPWRAIVAVAHAHFARGGRVAARATLDAGRRIPALAGHARFMALDPGAIVAGLPAARATGRLALGRDAPANGARVAYRLRLVRSRLAGYDLDRLAVAGRGRRGVHRIVARVAAAPGTARVRSRIALAEPVAYRAAARFDLARLETLLPPLPGRVAGRARLAGRGAAPADRHATLDVVATRGELRGVPLTRATVNAGLDGTAIRLAGAALDAGRSHAEASGTLDLAARRAELVVAAHADLGELDPEMAGGVDLTATARGPLDALAVAATGTTEGARYRDLALRSGRLTLAGRGLGGREPAATMHVDATAVCFRTGSEYGARGDVDWRRAGADDRVRVTLDAHAPDGGVQSLDVAVTHGGARTMADVRTLVVTAMTGDVWRLAAPSVLTLDDGVATDGLVLVSGAQHAALSGRIGLHGASSAALRLDAVSLGPLCALAGTHACAGTLSGAATLRGTASAPLLDVEAHADPIRVRAVTYSVALAVHYADASARVDGTIRQPTAGALVLAGTVPVDLAWAGSRRDLRNAPVSLTVRADALDLAIVPVVIPRMVREASGRIDVDLRVVGPRAAPRPTGTVTLADASLELAATHVVYESVRARVVADGARVTLEELRATGGDGTLEAHGGLVVQADGTLPIDLAVRLDRFFAVRQRAYEAALSGDVAVRGSVQAPDVTGELDVERAVVRPAGLPGSGPAIRPDPTIVVVGEPVREPEPPDEGPGAAVAGALRCALHVRIARNAWIRRNDANIELGGDLHVTKAPGEPVRISGHVDLLRGWYEFQGRRFDVEQGTITFTGAAPPKPVFDVSAVHQTAEYRITVKVTGSIDKPKLELSSEPPLEKADILSVLLFGKPAQDLGKGQSVALQQQALALAAGYVMPELRTSVMNVLGVDTLDVQMPEGTVAPGRVSAGRYVAEDVFVSLAQEFGTRTSQVVGVEYSLGRSVSVKASTSTRGNSAIDLFWRYRY